MLKHKFNNLFGLPELEFTKESSQHKNTLRLHCRKTSKAEVCPKCTTLSKVCYDKRTISVQDTPIRNRTVYLKITKRRFFCKACKKPFTEPIQGIIKGYRTTQRFRKHILWFATHFSDLKKVQEKCRCSSWLVHKAYYEQAELEVRKLQNPWGKTVGIDEHSFVRNTKFGYR